MMKVETVSGMLTNLPCNITPSVPGDRVLIVLWYKDGYGKPLYSFDLRDDSTESEALLWANEDGGDIPRAQLNVKSQPTAFLSLLGVEERDGGIYRCRVDFKKSPTRFWKVDLTVIGTPYYSYPNIFTLEIFQSLQQSLSYLMKKELRWREKLDLIMRAQPWS